MSKFKVDDKITMKENAKWLHVFGVPVIAYPEFGKIYTVANIDFWAIDNGCGYWTIGLLELQRIDGKYDGWDENGFEKVVSDEVLRYDLEEMKEIDLYNEDID